MTEVERPSRFSQAQVLIAALFAVVLSGDLPNDVRLGDPEQEPCPEEHLPKLQPLRLQFAAATGRSKWRPWLEWKCDLTPTAAEFLLYTPLMPSFVRAAIEREVADCGMQHEFSRLLGEQGATFGRRRALRVLQTVGARIGVEPRMLRTCYREKLTDEQWQAAHDFLARLDSGQLWRTPAIHGLDHDFPDIACPLLGVSKEYLWACLQGYEHDARVRGAARAVAKAMNKAHGRFWTCSLREDRARVIDVLRPFVAAATEAIA